MEPKDTEREGDSSTGDAKSEAESYIRLMESSAFIVAVSVAQFVLSYLALVTKTLQAKQCDLVQAYRRGVGERMHPRCKERADLGYSMGSLWVSMEISFMIAKTPGAVVEVHPRV